MIEYELTSQYWEQNLQEWKTIKEKKNSKQFLKFNSKPN